MRLDELGERSAVELLRKLFDRGHPIGIGDDCAALEWDGDYLLLTTDVINQRAHMPPGATPYQLGWYLVAVNLSDIAAMGGRPLGFLGAVSLPPETSVDFLRELARGMEACAREFGIAVVGGDTKEAAEISLAGTAFGKVARDRILLRRGARAGDAVVVTGEIGRSGLAYRHLLEPERRAAALEVLLRPYPRVEEGKLFSESRAVTSCMDVSDGLGATLGQMAKLGGVHFEVTWGRLPLPTELARLHWAEAKELGLHYGGDYELVATVTPSRLAELRRRMEESRHRITVIGSVAEHGENLLHGPSGTERLEDRGWEHFRPRPA